LAPIATVENKTEIKPAKGLFSSAQKAHRRQQAKPDRSSGNSERPLLVCLAAVLLTGESRTGGIKKQGPLFSKNDDGIIRLLQVSHAMIYWLI